MYSVCLLPESSGLQNLGVLLEGRLEVRGTRVWNWRHAFLILAHTLISGAWERFLKLSYPTVALWIVGDFVDMWYNHIRESISFASKFIISFCGESIQTPPFLFLAFVKCVAGYCCRQSSCRNNTTADLISLVYLWLDTHWPIFLHHPSLQSPTGYS